MRGSACGRGVDHRFHLEQSLKGQGFLIYAVEFLWYMENNVITLEQEQILFKI